MTNGTRRLWLAADYHLPATYSCSWGEIDPFAPPEKTNPFHLDIYVWPLHLRESLPLIS